MSVLREVRVARRYFVGSQYHDAAMHLLEGLAADTPEQTAAKIRALPTEETLFSQLTERLKGKSVIKNLKKLGEGRESPIQKSIALSSLLTHVLIETSTNKEYGTLISSVTRALVESLDANASFGNLFEDTPATGNETEEAPAVAEGGEESTLMSFGSGKYYYLVKTGDALKIVDALGTELKTGSGDVAAFVQPIMSEFGDLVSREFLSKYNIMQKPELPPVAEPNEGPDGQPLPAAPAGGGGSGGGGSGGGGGAGAPPPMPEGEAPAADGEMPEGAEGAPTEGAEGGDGEVPPIPEGEGEQAAGAEAPAPEEAPAEEPPVEEPAPEEAPVEEPAPEAPAEEEFTPEEKEEIDRQARRAQK